MFSLSLLILPPPPPTFLIRYQWESGAVYEGEVRSNDLSGSGRYTWADGSTYEGEVLHGERHGRGVFTFGAVRCVLEPPTHTGTYK